MKKILILLATLTLTASLVACSTPSTDESSSSEESSNVESSEDESSEESSNVESSEESSTDSEAPVVDEKITEAYNAIIDTVYGENAEFKKGELADIDEMMFLEMTGLNAEQIESYKAVMPMMNVKVDHVIIVKATEGNAANVETTLNTYKDTKIAALDPEQGGFPYLPGHLEMAKSATVVTFGDYVLYISVADLTGEEPEGELLDVTAEFTATAVEAATSVLG